MKHVMQIFVIPVLLLSVMIVGERESEAEAKVRWYSFNKGMQVAKKLKKPVIIDFYADWCKWCKVMEKQTFQDPKVARKLRKSFVTIRIDLQREKRILNFQGKKFTAREFAGYLGASALPTVVFLDKKRTPITKIPGFIKKDTFLSLLGYMEKECYAKKVAFDDYMKGNTLCTVR